MKMSNDDGRTTRRTRVADRNAIRQSRVKTFGTRMEQFQRANGALAPRGAGGEPPMGSRQPTGETSCGTSDTPPRDLSGYRWLLDSIFRDK